MQLGLVGRVAAVPDPGPAQDRAVAGLGREPEERLGEEAGLQLDVEVAVLRVAVVYQRLERRVGL